MQRTCLFLRVALPRRARPIKGLTTSARVFAVRKKDSPNQLADTFLEILKEQSRSR